MQYLSFWRPLARSTIAAGLLLLCTYEAFAADSYTAGVLTMPSLAIGNATFSNVVVDVGTIVSGPSGSAANGSTDSYDPTTGHLTVQSVVYAGKTYYNVVATVKSLVSIGSVTGADTYSNGQLTAPFVRLPNGALYAEATVTVATIDSPGGGMPQAIQDVYNPANRQLTIAAVLYNGKVYTNAIVTVASATVAAYGAVVPNVVGDTEAAAGAALNAAVLGATVTQQLSSTVPQGNVISQSPPAGTEVIEGSLVGLVVSAGAESLLYSFGPQRSKTDGNFPLALIEAIDANNSKVYLYGTTGAGGTNNNGTVFQLSLTGTESVVYSLPAPVTSGTYIANGLILGSDDNFYGTSAGGGLYGGGILYKLTPAGTETTLYNFCGCIDNVSAYEGVQPNGLIQGTDGNFYGTTPAGGYDSSGTLFVIPASGLGQVLYYFGSVSKDAQIPVGNLVQGKDLNLYGVSDQGGVNGTGTVFRVAPYGSSAGTETLLHSFDVSGSTTDGQVPAGGLVQAANGNFYGMTLKGGANNTGAIYVITLTPTIKETILYSFGPPVGGFNPTPAGALIQASDGNFYGVTEYGGSYNGGSIFKMTPSGSVSTVHSFSGGVADGQQPDVLIQGTDGNLYGGTFYGGANDTGTIFKVIL